MKNKISQIKKGMAGAILFTLSLFVACGFSSGNKQNQQSDSTNTAAGNNSTINTAKSNESEGNKAKNNLAQKAENPTDLRAPINKEARIKASKSENTNATVKQGKAQQITSLKQAYANYFPIGAAIEPRIFLGTQAGRDFIANQFASITPANAMKPTRIHPKEGVYNFAEADNLVAYAKSNGLLVRGHNLVWPTFMPRWMLYDGNKLASKELLLKRLKDHITTVVSRYKGKVYCWDVVNECVASIGERTTFRRVDTLNMIAGEEYVEKAFEYAHAADPNAKLFYNDEGYNFPVKRDRMYQFVKRLKAKGVPIDGVGMETHLGIEGMPEDMLKQNIEMFSSLGVDVQITELDVSIYKGRAKKADILNLSDSYTDDIASKQAAVFDMVFRVCRQEKGKITGLTLWSPADWDNSLTTRFGKKNYPYLFDRSMKPKKALNKILNFNNNSR